MKKLIATIALLTGSSSALAHTLSLQEGIVSLYHQLLGMHHLPLTLLLIVLGVALLRGLRKKVS